jgi:hypothetical protein
MLRLIYILSFALCVLSGTSTPTDAMNASRDEVDILYPCSTPPGLLAPDVQVDARHVVDIQYRRDPQVPYPELRIMEQPFREGFSVMDGRIERVGDIDVTVSVRNGSVAVEWTTGGVRYNVVSVFSLEDTLAVVHSMLYGCDEHI